MGAKHGGQKLPMFAKFKAAMDNAVGYDYPLREFDTFQDATAFYNNHWFNLGFVVPKKRSSWKSNIKRDWLAPGKGLVSVFEEGEQDYPRQHWLFSVAPSEPGLLEQIKAARRPCAKEPAPKPAPASDNAKASYKELRRFKKSWRLPPDEDISVALKKLEAVWPLVHDEPPRSATDQSPLTRARNQELADGRWQAAPYKRAAVAQMNIECCGSSAATATAIAASHVLWFGAVRPFSPAPGSPCLHAHSPSLA